MHVEMRDCSSVYAAGQSPWLSMIRCRSPQYKRKSMHQVMNSGVHHTPWSRVMRRKIRLALTVAGMTGRIETIVVPIPRSDRKSPVDAEEYHDRLCRRPPIGPAKQGQTNLLRRLQEACINCCIAYVVVLVCCRAKMCELSECLFCCPSMLPS